MSVPTLLASFHGSSDMLLAIASNHYLRKAPNGAEFHESAHGRIAILKCKYQRCPFKVEWRLVRGGGLEHWNCQKSKKIHDHQDIPDQTTGPLAEPTTTAQSGLLTHTASDQTASAEETPAVSSRAIPGCPDGVKQSASAAINHGHALALGSLDEPVSENLKKCGSKEEQEGCEDASEGQTTVQAPALTSPAVALASTPATLTEAIDKVADVSGHETNESKSAGDNLDTSQTTSETIVQQMEQETSERGDNGQGLGDKASVGTDGKEGSLSIPTSKGSTSSQSQAIEAGEKHAGKGRKREDSGDGHTEGKAKRGRVVGRSA